MTAPCGCCAGTEPVTPAAIANRPGLPAVAYRVGTYATFLETMLARISSVTWDAATTDPRAAGTAPRTRPLSGLKTRSADDPAVAWLDAWAVVGDVLTFYQERIANEGFLRTATERRSVLELARLIGYVLRPGVAATVYLAYELDQDRTVTPPKPIAVTIPAGSRVQSVPGPDELPQTFEAADPLDARSAWNDLRPRQTQPQDVSLDEAQIVPTISFEGTGLGLATNDRLLLVFGDDPGQHVLRSVQDVDVDAEAKRTQVALQPVPLLVIALVRLLQFAVDELAATIDAISNSGTQVELLAWLQDLRRWVLVILETFRLGRYPVLDQSYFGHDLFYGPLRQPGALEVRAAALRTNATFLGAIPVGRLMAVTRQQFWDEPATLEVVRAVLRKANDLLGDETLRKELTCLATAAFANARPSGAADRRLLERPLERIGAPDVKVIKDRIALLTTPQTDPTHEAVRTSAKALVDNLLSLLASPDLRNETTGLVSDLRALLKPQSPGLELLKLADDQVAAVAPGPPVDCDGPAPVVTTRNALVDGLLTRPSVPPASSARLARTLASSFGNDADAAPQLLTAFHPELRETYYRALANAAVSSAARTLRSVHAFRLVAPLFGYNAALKTGIIPNPTTDEKEKAAMPFLSVPNGDWDFDETSPHEEAPRALFLDAAYDAIIPDSYVVVQMPFPSLATTVESATTRPRTAYGMSGKTTLLGLGRSWWSGDGMPTMNDLRSTIVYAQSVELTLAEVPDTSDISGRCIKLGALYDGLHDGRWLIVSGEITDVEGTSGVTTSELAMLAKVEQEFDLATPDDPTLTVITLADDLVHRYKRDSVAIYGNVAKATHGETRTEVLGSGDGTKSLQQFALRQPPLTFLPAPTPSGALSTLQVRVDDVLWHEAEDVAELGPTDRRYVTRIDDDGTTSVVFGTGEFGERLPTGQENVKAVYRQGLGKGGNVKPGQLTLLLSRPLGVKGVTNPLGASGGAERESRDDARANAPLVVTALDRLVSTQDYADFARTFAGIGKASAARLPEGGQQVVHVTIAGADDIPIDPTSDLYRNLCRALRDYGDPAVPVLVELRDLLALVLSAKVRTLPDYDWDLVQPKVRAALLDHFGFARRALGQDALLSELFAVIQQVDGVDYVDVDVLGAVPGVDPATRKPTTPDGIAAGIAKLVNDPRQPRERVRAQLAQPAAGGIQPAQLAVFLPDVPATLILNEVPA